MGLFDGVVADRQRQELLMTGQQAQATVTGVKSLGRTSAAGMLTEIALQIDPVGGRPFAKTIHEWLPPGVESGLSIGSVVSVRHHGKTVVLESTDGSGTGGQPAWAPPPVVSGGPWQPGPGRADVGTTLYQTSTTISGMTDPQAVADAVRAALEQVSGLTPHLAANLGTLVEAPATILEVTPGQAEGLELFDVRLRVEPDGHQPFETVLPIQFSSPERRAACVPGKTLRVRYNPANPALVLVVPHSLH